MESSASSSSSESETSTQWAWRIKRLEEAEERKKKMKEDVLSRRWVSVAKHIRRMSIKSGGLLVSNLQTFIESGKDSDEDSEK